MRNRPFTLLAGCVLLTFLILVVWLILSDSGEGAPSHTGSKPPEQQGSPSLPREERREQPEKAVSVLVTGHVRDASEAPIPGAALLLRPVPVDATEDVAPLVQRLSDESGFYSFSPKCPGNYALSAVAEGFVAEERVIKVREGKDITLDFHLERLALVSGIVVSEGGLDTRRIKVTYTSRDNRLERGVAELDGSGRFSLALAPGAYTFGVCSSTHSMTVEGTTDTLPYGALHFAVRKGRSAPRALQPTDKLVFEHALSLHGGEVVDDLVVVLPARANRVAGRVVTQTGEAVEQAHLCLVHDGVPIGNTASDASGMFALEHLAVTAKEAEGFLLSVSGTPNPRDQFPAPQEVYLGQQDALVVIQRGYEPMRLTLSGRVVDSNTGAGIRNAAISPESSSKPPVISGRNGSFKLTVSMLADQARTLGYRVTAEGYMEQVIPLRLDPQAPPAEPVLFALDAATSELTVRFLPPAELSLSQITSISADLSFPISEPASEAAYVPLCAWQYSESPDQVPPPLSFTKKVFPQVYRLVTHFFYTISPDSSRNELTGFPSRISYKHIRVDEIPVQRSGSKYDIEISGDAQLEIALPTIHIKEVSGRIWHCEKVVERENHIDKIVQNNGYTGFIATYDESEVPVSCVVPYLPPGIFFTELEVTPMEGLPRTKQELIELENGMTTVVSVE